MSIFRLLLFFLCASCVPALCQAAEGAPEAREKFTEVLLSPGAFRQLQRGGYVLYMRHGQTDGSRPDRMPEVDLDDCTTQRPLTEEGRRTALRVGEAIRKARLPIGDIHISPLCRVRDTASAAFPRQTPLLDKHLMYTANLTAQQKEPILARTRQLLSTTVAAGRLRLLIAHAPNLMDIMGYFPREGTVVVFQPLGDGRMDYLGSIPPDYWNELLR